MKAERPGASKLRLASRPSDSSCYLKTRSFQKCAHGKLGCTSCSSGSSSRRIRISSTGKSNGSVIVTAIVFVIKPYICIRDFGTPARRQFLGYGVHPLSRNNTGKSNGSMLDITNLA